MLDDLQRLGSLLSQALMALRVCFLLRLSEVYLQAFLFVLVHLQVQEYFLWLEAEASSTENSVYFDF